MSGGPDYDVKEASSCKALNTSTLFLNTSDTSDGVYVKVSCAEGYQLVSLHPDTQAPDVFHCTESIWMPSLPRCSATPSSNNSTRVGIIAGCTVGGVVCVVIVLVAIYMLCRSRKEGKQEKENDDLHKSKMIHMNFFMSSFLQDNVGMPAVTEETMDNDLRGVTSSTCPVTSQDEIYYNMATADSRSCASSAGVGAKLSRRGSVESITSAGGMELGDEIVVEKF